MDCAPIVAVNSKVILIDCIFKNYKTGICYMEDDYRQSYYSFDLDNTNLEIVNSTFSRGIMIRDLMLMGI